MTSKEFQERLIRRLHRAGKLHTPVPSASQLSRLESYFRLLARWNAKINLTALPLERPTDETFDRLFVEPLVAARHFPTGAATWVDLGTGGGSPAIPLKIVLPPNRLMMVESKVRKTIFLRETVRTLELPEAVTVNERLERFAERLRASAEAITVRAVRPDMMLFAAATRLLAPGGRLLLFQADTRKQRAPQLEHLETVQLIDGQPVHLSIYAKVFHVEQPVDARWTTH